MTAVHDITRFGAVGDGATLNTAAIQQAIDAAGETDGGTVVVPPGTFLTGTIFLRSGITLQLHPAGRILGSPDLADYREKSWGQHIDRTPWHLLVAHHLHDITITGGGAIDGNGPAFWEPCVPGPHADENTYVPPGAFGGMDPITAVAAREPDPDKAVVSWIRANKEERPSPMIEITGCTNVRIHDIHITNSAGWNLHVHNSNHVWIRGVKLTSNLMGPNNDGFDITGCHDVMVSDCDLSCCDDAIVLKTTPDSNTIERVTVTNCVMRTKCAALKFGCNESFHDFRNVTFSNCTVHESSRAVALYVKNGGTVEDVAISNIVCDTRNPFVMNRPIQIDCFRGEPGSKLGKIRNMTVSNMICRTDGRILLSSDPESPLENIVLRDIQMIYPTVDDPAPIAHEIKCGQFTQNHPEAQAARAVVVAANVRDLVLDNLMVQWPEADEQRKVECPEGWRFPVKACNGMFDKYYFREQFNTDTLPEFHVLWGAGLEGGYISAPLAKPSFDTVEPYILNNSSIRVR